MKDKLLKIINHYGILPQLKYIHSEYFELDESILNAESQRYEGKHCGIPEHLKEHITEEIADVMVMLYQFRYYYKLEDEEIFNKMNYKIDRQLKRIEDEQNER